LSVGEVEAMRPSPFGGYRIHTFLRPDSIDFLIVTPAKAGVHLISRVVEKMDSGFRRNDDKS
jgi:hypothetical protein